MANTTYTTKEKDRWDIISTICYGSPNYMGLLIESNPSVLMYDILPANLILTVPILEQVITLTNTELLPLWKQ